MWRKEALIRKKRGLCKLQSTAPVWASLSFPPLQLCELTDSVMSQMDDNWVAAPTGLYLVASTVWASAPRTVSLSCSLNQEDASLLTYSKASVAIHMTYPAPQSALCLLLPRESKRTTFWLDIVWWVRPHSSWTEREIKVPRKSGVSAGQDPCPGQC